MHPCPLMLCLHAKSNCPSMWVFLNQSCHQVKYTYLVKYEIYRIYTCLRYLFLDVNSLSSTYIKKSQWKMIGKSIKLFSHFSLLTLNRILVFRHNIYHNQLFWYKNLWKTFPSFLLLASVQTNNNNDSIIAQLFFFMIHN